MNLSTDTIRLAILIGLVVACSVLEALWPLRQRTQARGKRWLQNILIGLSSALVLKLAVYPIVLIVADVATTQGWGLFTVFDAPSSVRLPLVILALDYTLYLWHQLMHRVPFLWRFHNVHHLDLDLDTTTALRFHFGELSLSAFYRSAQVLLLGVSAFELMLFELCVTSSAQFHHSNLRLPRGIERILSLVTITPRLHGIHHSIIRQETDSNFGIMLSIWDRLHRTLKTRIPQALITIGVPAYQEPREIGFFSSLWLPFQKQRPWPPELETRKEKVFDA